MLDSNCVLVKLSPEITLKSHFVRVYFVNKLISNIKQVLRAKSISKNKIKRGGGRLYIFPKNKKNIQKIAESLKFVFGVQSAAVCRSIQSSKKEEIKKEALKTALGFIKPKDSFAIRLKRVGEKTFSTKEIEAEIGSLVKKKIKDLKVDLTNPKKKVSIEVRPGESFFYTGEIKGPIGLPLGVEGNAGVFFNGKKEELLAAFLMMKRGCNVFPILPKKTFKLQEHVNKLCKWNSYRAFKFSLKKDVKELIEKNDISIKAIVRSDKIFNETLKEQKTEFEVPVLWPLMFFPKPLEKKYLNLLGLS